MAHPELEDGDPLLLVGPAATPYHAFDQPTTAGALIDTFARRAHLKAAAQCSGKSHLEMTSAMSSDSPSRTEPSPVAVDA